jgi:hypothetical protein
MYIKENKKTNRQCVEKLRCKHFPELGLLYITAAATNNTQFFL